jgi:hypothetical protein
MTFYEANPEVRPTGAEAGEFLDDLPEGTHHDDDDDAEADADPTRRPSGAPPLDS